jgi:hypothetical protein
MEHSEEKSEKRTFWNKQGVMHRYERKRESETTEEKRKKEDGTKKRGRTKESGTTERRARDHNNYRLRSRKSS